MSKATTLLKRAVIGLLTLATILLYVAIERNQSTEDDYRARLDQYQAAGGIRGRDIIMKKQSPTASYAGFFSFLSLVGVGACMYALSRLKKTVTGPLPEVANPSEKST